MSFSYFPAFLVLAFALLTLGTKVDYKDEFNGFFQSKPKINNISNANSTTGIKPNTSLITRCQDIPRKPIPPLREFVNVGTFTMDLTLDPQYDDSTVMYVSNAKSDLDAKSSYANIVVGFGETYFNLDSMFTGEYCNTTNCQNNQHVTWFMHNLQFETPEKYYCVFSCYNDALQNYVCVSTKPIFTLEQAENLASLKNVPGVEKVHPARINTCQTNKNTQCKMGNLNPHQ